MSAPRWAHHIYANWFGYFWLPCPRCGRMFGGHEIHGHTSWHTPDDRTWATCARCTPSEEELAHIEAYNRRFAPIPRKVNDDHRAERG